MPTLFRWVHAAGTHGLWGKEVAAFREQVRTELVPLCEQLYAAQAKRIGVDTLMFYDEKRVFPDGNAVPAGR